MAITPQAIDRLKSQLLTSGLQRKDNPLFQVINQLIDAVRDSLVATNALTGSGGGGGGITGATYLTSDSEIATLPASRQVIAGAGIQFNDSPNGRRVISTALPLGGERGEDGEDGLIGPQGLQGPTGPQGSNATSIFYAYDGEDGVDGLPGITGPQGFTGSIGPQGMPGMAGIDGLDGESGEEGIQGATGNIGPTGIQGIQGFSGIPGIDGIDGIDGLPGLPGTNGINGTIGINGLPGPPGMDAEEPDYPLIIPGPQGIQGPAGGGGGGSATTVVVTAAFPAKRNQRVNVVDGTVVATSNVLVWISGIVNGQPNAGDLVDIHAMRAIANIGSFDLDMDFLTPWAGSLSIDYMVMT